MDIKRPKSNQQMPEDAKRVFKGILFDTYQWEQEMYDGTKATFERLRRPDTVVVYPVLEDGKILMISDEQPLRGVRIIAPGGRVNKDEDILDAAKRELLEETGYEAKEFSLWYSVQPITKIEWGVYVFIARGLSKAKDQNIDEGEKISILPVTFDEFLDRIISGSDFADFDIRSKILEAKLDPKKMEELKELFKPL
jgi:8-oxo-dGTP pyrophosphatase MutT (NUDIX family)